jgi:tRNA pseudouridine55 synthase
VLDGILLVDKPSGMTSADVVRAVKRAHRTPSIGHLGTLDPMATGLLPLCLGGGTKIAQFLGTERKSYRGEIQLGIATDTLDVTGRVVEERTVPVVSAGSLGAVAARFLGRQEQRPPMYSAVKVGGRELYKIARAGGQVDREPRPIEIYAFELRPVPEQPDRLAFSVDCSKGTYVRVLAEDVGRALDTVAALSALRRTRFGSFRVEQATPLEALIATPPGPLPLVGLREAMAGAREIAVDGPTAFAVATGQQRVLQERIAPAEPGERFAALIAPNEQVLAVLEAGPAGWELRRVLLPEASQLYRS